MNNDLKMTTTFSSLPFFLSTPPNYSLFLLSHRCVRFRRYRSAVTPNFLLRYRSRGQSNEGHEKESFGVAVDMFNQGDYYGCHDVLEEIWNDAEEPVRTLIHGILQCAVGFYHLFNQNHRGAMMELGEGVCKLRKMRFEDDCRALVQFESEVSVTLEFLYQMQRQLGDPSNSAGMKFYAKKSDDIDGNWYIISNSDCRSDEDEHVERVKLPILLVTEEQLNALIR